MSFSQTHITTPSKVFFRRASKKASKEFLNSLRPVESFTRRLINASATGDSSYNHRDAGRLWSVIPQANELTQQPPSMEKARFLAQNHVSPDHNAKPLGSEFFNDTVKPGTFVELRRNRIVTHGIVLQLKILEARMHSFTLTYTGEVWPHLINDITYVIPNFVSQDLMERAGDGYKALSAAETTARLQIVDQIRTFTRQHERHFNALSKDALQLYDKIRNPDPNQWADITTPEASKFLDTRRPPPVLTLFAMHSHLMGRPLYYVADSRNHMTTHRFAIRPLSHVQAILQVNEWVRRRDPAFESFVKTARKVIKKAREITQKYWDVPPIYFDGRLAPWSPSDLVFIQYLQHALRASRTIQEDPYDRALPTILKTINMYRDFILDPGLAQLLLTELGVLTPWEDVVLRSPELRLDCAPPGQSKRSQTLDELVQHAITKPNTPASPALRRKLNSNRLEGSTELLPRDLLKAQRHDFGDLPVYVVDDDFAQELDDGISIESVPGELGNYWIRVHVADPTTVIPPGHVLDLQANKAVLTFYSSHRTWSMLPPALAQPLFSLGAKSAVIGQEVLTFSLKMSDSGEFLDYDVRAGLVRNLHILTYNQADRLLGLKHSYFTYPLPGELRPTVSGDSIPEICHSDLQKLRHIADLFLCKTIKANPIINFAFPRATVEFRDPLPVNPPLPPRPMLWKGFPSMTYVVENPEQTPSTFRQTVAEWMKLACRAASRFCNDRGIPAIRRGSSRMCGTTPADTEFLLSSRDAGGYVDPFEGLKRNMYALPGEPTIFPSAHHTLGIPEGEGYSRVTSPLRRYGDLIMHWQIKHALIPGNDRPLFSEEYLESLMHRLHEREKASSAVRLIYNRHWAHACLARYIQGERLKHGPNYEPFPELLARTIGSTALDTMNATGQVPVIIPSLGVQGELKGVNPTASFPIGTTIAVKIGKFKPGIPSQLHLVLA